MKNLPENLQNEIKQKGFAVYNYISFKELMQTVKRDYLSIMSTINIGLAFIFVVTVLINPLLLLYIIPTIYGLVFLLLSIKLFLRTKKYFYVNQVIFTQTKILIGEDILEYKEGWKHNSILSEYEEDFNEYLSRPSKLSEIITKKEKSLTNDVKNILEKGYDLSSSSNKSNNIIMIALVTYAASLYIFYYIGLVFGVFFFAVVGLFIKIFLFFSKKTELQIKFSIEKIEDDIKKLVRTESVLARKINNFSEGEISDIADFVGNKFEHFYSVFSDILLEQKKLEHIIHNSKYKKFIDFQIFSKYLKTEYNKPVQHMTKMLEIYLEKIVIQKNEIITEREKLENSNKNLEFFAHLTKKELTFAELEKNAQNHLNMITQLIL